MKSVRKKRFKKTCEFHVSQIKWAKVNKNVKSKVKICGDKVLKTKEKKMQVQIIIFVRVTVFALV